MIVRRMGGQSISGNYIFREQTRKGDDKKYSLDFCDFSKSLSDAGIQSTIATLIGGERAEKVIV